MNLVTFYFIDSGSTCRMNNFEPVCNSYNTKGYLTITRANWTHGCAWNYNTIDVLHDVTSILQGYCGNHYDCVEMISDDNILPCSTDYYHYSYHNFSDTFMCKQTGWQTCERTNTSVLNHRFILYCGIVYWDYNCTSKWKLSCRVSEWLLFNATWAIFQLYHDENKLHSMKWWWCAICAGPACLAGYL